MAIRNFGGGSSDAAAVLLALPVLAGRALDDRQVHEIAARLGSDVAFFLLGGRAVGIGRGSELFPLPDRSAGDERESQARHIFAFNEPAELVYRIGFNPLHRRVWRGQ